MEDYPAQYVEHNLPLIALSGIANSATVSGSSNSQAQNAGARIAVNQPSLDETTSNALRRAFEKVDGSQLPWNGDGHPDRPGLIGYRFENTGRSLIYPRRKAAPAPQAPSEDPGVSSASSNTINHDLHSTLSPLSPTSPLFPDGLMSTLWLDKHQREVPSVLLCFFSITSDTSTASLQDNQMKIEINGIKTALSKSGFRTRLAVVLVSEQSGDTASDLDDRLSIIRRATGLDPKSAFFYLPHPDPDEDLSSFVVNVLSALQPVCIDYYRDLTKHARRKKNRGYIPPPTGASARGTSQSLSTQGWNTRYEFKQGIFAEFRQEMDAAERHYTFAIEELFNPEGVLENTPIWSARWEEARMLADVIAIRMLRCQLWRSLTSGAAESWSNYRERMRDLIDRRGKGTATYGYAAWESRWAEIMAQLITRAQIPAFKIPEAPGEAADEDEGETEQRWVPINITAPPEKSYASAERQPPFRIMHHAGYWYRMAQSWALERYRRAKEIPDEDRTVLDQRSSGQFADRIRTYDTYLAAPPHEELPTGKAFNDAVVVRIVRLTDESQKEFARRRQYRMRSQLCLEQARLLGQTGKPDVALDVLLPVWDEMSWRREHWWGLATDVIAELYELSKVCERPRLQAELRWEMASDAFGSKFTKQLSENIQADTTAQTPIVLDAGKRLAPITATFSFANEEGHVGDMVPCQLAVGSSGGSQDGMLQLQKVTITLNDGAWNLSLRHVAEKRAPQVKDVVLQDATATQGGSRHCEAKVDLVSKKNGTRVFNLSPQLRDVGELVVTSIMTEVLFHGYTVQHTYSEQHGVVASNWWLDGGNNLVARALSRDDSHYINVLPKPPRVQVYLAETREQYLTSEEVVLDLVLLNEEYEVISGHIQLDMADDILSAIEARWQDIPPEAESGTHLKREIKNLPSHDQTTYTLAFKAPNEAVNLPLSVTIEYAIDNDPATTVTKTTTFNFKFVHPFELSFDLKPRLDTDSWPSFFSMPPPVEEGESHTEGVRQKWSLSSRLVSSAIEPLSIESFSLSVSETSDNVVCDVPQSPNPAALKQLLAPGSLQSLPLDFHTRKTTLEDRRPASVSLDMTITWRRQSASGAVTTTTLAIPTLHIPPAEPRVLCTVCSAFHQSRSSVASDVQRPLENTRIVRYTLENPSLHYLTFTLTMDASDQFAFSGPKSRSVALTPLSRVSVEYRLMILNADGSENAPANLADGQGGGKKARGKWVYPVFRVMDSYFNKSLRVIDAGPGVRSDERRSEDGRASGGVGVWVPVSET